MIKSYKVRLEPNNKQNTMLFQRAGASRWAYNWTLARQKENYEKGNKFLSDGDLRREITQLKKTSEYEWLNQYSVNIVKQAVKDACNAYKRFFKGQAQFPKFKSRKKSAPSFYNDTHKIKFSESQVFIEKFGWIKLSEKNRVPTDGKYYNPRITFDGVHWHVAVGVETNFNQNLCGEKSVGIDLGIKSLAVCSNGMTFQNINKSKRVNYLEKKLRRMQRKVSRKYEKNKVGSQYKKTKNIIKLEYLIKKLHKKLANIRTDYIHQLTTKIVKTKPSRVVMEHLNVSGMLKNKHLAKSIAQQRFYEFKIIMKAKCEMYGIEFVEADKWFPSSKTCSECGCVKKKLSLSERKFECENCKAVIDRDFNASINLARYELT